MKTWEEKKIKYLEILENTNKTIEEIMTIDATRKIIGNNYDDIIDLKENNEKYYNKLDKDLFEVAIIGLEKAGKSTFVNALIKSNLMPEGESRCTYTSTQLEYGDNQAIIEFFTVEDFNTKFQSMLKDIDFSNYENINFDVITLDIIENFFEQLKNKDIKMEEELKEIVKFKNEIKKYLSKNNIIFSGDQLFSNEFKSYITNPEKARAVKKIILKSKMLSSMQNIIVYDVPGFDSPTLIHESQTMDKIKNCDAIILVTDVSSKPNLNLHQLQVLLKESDNDGVKINEKFFVFGNKIDRCNDKYGTQVCMNSLIDDVKKYGIATEDRIFNGSAYAYLKHINNEEDHSVERMKEFDLEKNIKEPELLKEKLEQYNKNERFGILERKINMNINRIKELFNTIITENKNHEKSNINFLSNELILKYYDNFKTNIDKKLTILNDDIKSKRKTYKDEFEKKLADAMNLNITEITIDLIDEISKEDSTIADGLSLERINIKSRERLYTDSLEKFNNVILDITDIIAEDINCKIINNFIDSLELSDNNIYYHEIKAETIKKINEVIEPVKFDKRMILPLVERFSRSIFDVVLYCPLTSNDRLSKFKSVKQDIYSLSTYDPDFISLKPFYAQPIIKLIFSHSNSYSLEDIVKKLTKILDVVGEKEILDFSKKIFLNEIDFDSFIESINTSINSKKNNMVRNYKSTLIKIIDTQISKQIQIQEITEDSFIDDIRRKTKKPNTKEEIVDEINKDVELLKTILLEIVIKAMSLEKPFLSIMNKQVICLKESVSRNEFIKFFSDYANKIKHQEFGKLEIDKAEYENKKKIVIEIEKALLKFNI